MERSVSAERRRRNWGWAAGVSEGLVEKGAVWLNPKWVEDLNIQEEKRISILKTSLTRSFEFQEGIMRPG